MELPIKQYQDGSKSSFIQAPYISIARDETVKGIQEEITNSWPEGIITYYLDDNSYDISIGDRIRKAMSVLEAAACIRFRNESIKPKGNVSWIHITNPDKKRQCVHDPKSVKKGEIMLTLGYDCLEHEDLIHSLLHGIGFKDEITHPHRDKYIRVLWDNIQPAHRHLYRVQPVHTSRSIVEYDPLSIMHFHDRAFSSNGKATIVPLEPGLVISPSESLSQLDKMRLHLYFGHECNKRKFSSLMETCKKTLKGEQPAEDDHDRDGGNDTVTDDTKENKENEEGKETTDENNVSGDVKQGQKETENLLIQVSVTAEEKENSKVSVTAEEKENQKVSVTAEEKENQKVSVTAEEKENLKVSVTAEEKENQKVSVTAEEKENLKVSVTAEEKENQKVSVTAEEKENPKVSVTAEEEENLKVSVTAEEKENQKVSVTAEEQENQKVSVTAEEKENLKVSVTAEEQENPKVSVTAEEKENLKQSDKSQNTTLTPVTVIQGLLLVQKDDPHFLPSIPNKEESGINFNYDSAEK